MDQLQAPGSRTSIGRRNVRARDKVVFAVERVFRHFLASALPVREPLLISLVIPGFSY